MSHNYCIRNLLNIKDKNIFFEENFCSEETVKGISSKIFYGCFWQVKNASNGHQKCTLAKPQYFPSSF